MNTHPPGTYRRFASAFLAFVAVVVALPALLILASRAALGAGHPVPGIGPTSDIRDWFGRELSTSEVVPIVLRSLLVVGWFLWAALTLSVISALVGSRPQLGHVRIPRLAMFDGVAVWIAAGLTVLSSLSPRVSFAETIPSTFAPIVHITPSPEITSAGVTSLPRIGYERVETGESIEMFAERTLGDGSRWTEIWEIGQDSVVDRATGMRWTEPWRLEGGWELRLPTPAGATGLDRPEQTFDAGEVESLGESGRLVTSGDSYWTIAEDLLLAHLDRDPTPNETAALTSTLMAHNASRLGYNDPAMIHPGDLIDLDVDIDAQRTPERPGDWLVGAGDSYWKIAADTLQARAGEVPTAQQTGELTAFLIELNADRLGYDDPEMLHPGDVVHTAAPEAAPADPPAAQDPPRPAPAPTPEPAVSEPSTQTAITEQPAVPLAPPAPSTATWPTIATVQTPPGPRVPVEAMPRPTLRTPPAGSDRTGGESTTNESRAPIGVLGGITLLTAAGLATAIRRRMRKAHQRRRPGQQRPKVSTASEAAIADVIYRDVSDVTWMDHELRFLAHLLGRADRTTMTIQLVQLGDGRTIEVAFTEIPETSPPGQWVSAADRVWRLDYPHDDEQLAAVQDAPPILPALVTLGAPEAGGQLYLNVEACDGVNVSGDDIAVQAWLANALWEVAGEAVGECSVVRVVGDVLSEALALPDGVELVSESVAIELLGESLLDVSTGARASMLSRRASRWEAWPSTIMVIVGETHDDRWDLIASATSAALISMNRRFASGLDIDIANGVLTVPALEIVASVPQLTESEQITIRTVLDEIEAEPIDQPTLQFDAPSGELIEVADDWEPPSWPVMINVLGTPAATKNGQHIKLTPQQLSALALIATRRELPAHDFKRAIWGDEDDVSAERVRDMLSVLRKKVGGLSVIPKREDGLVCAGADLGSDVLVFDALATRARTTPEELVERLHQMLDLVTGRLFNYSSLDQTWWRWSEIAFGMTDWTSKTTTAAETLARTYLDRSEPAAARDIAERGLIADPLNAALTEVLMEAYADLGALEAAQRVYESHDRQLDMSDLGGASNETKLVLERLRSHASSSVTTATEAAS